MIRAKLPAAVLYHERRVTDDHHPLKQTDKGAVHLTTTRRVPTLMRLIMTPFLPMR